MIETSYLKGHFLIAMPALQDPNFTKSVTLICEHNAEGAFGVIINHETEVNVSEVFEQLHMTPAEGNPYLEQKVFLGGPVEVDRGLILHKPTGTWDSTICQNEDVALTSSLDIMQAISSNQAPERFIMCLGYAGWGAGQLEQEIAENAWLSGPADYQVIFDTPIDQRWQAAANLLGIDLNLLSSDFGHA